MPSSAVLMRKCNVNHIKHIQMEEFSALLNNRLVCQPVPPDPPWGCHGPSLLGDIFTRSCFPDPHQLLQVAVEKKIKHKTALENNSSGAKCNTHESKIGVNALSHILVCLFNTVQPAYSAPSQCLTKEITRSRRVNAARAFTPRNSAATISKILDLSPKHNKFWYFIHLAN